MPQIQSSAQRFVLRPDLSVEEAAKLARDLDTLLAIQRQRAVATQRLSGSSGASGLRQSDDTEMEDGSRGPVDRMPQTTATTSVVGASTTTSRASSHVNSSRSHDSQHVSRTKSGVTKKELESLERAQRVQTLRTATLRRTATQPPGQIPKASRARSKDDIELVDGTHTAAERRFKTYEELDAAVSAVIASCENGANNSAADERGTTGRTISPPGAQYSGSLEILRELGYISEAEIKHVFDARELVLDDGVALTVELAKQRWDKRMLAAMDDETEATLDALQGIIDSNAGVLREPDDQNA